MDYLDGSRGLLPAFLGWMLVVYPLLTLPVFLRLLMTPLPVEDGEERPVRPRARRSRPRSIRSWSAEEPEEPEEEAWDEEAEPEENPAPRSARARRDRSGVRRLAELRAREREGGRRFLREPDLEPVEGVGQHRGRLLKAARRVADSRDLDRWIRLAAREYLEKTGTDEDW